MNIKRRSHVQSPLTRSSHLLRIVPNKSVRHCEPTGRANARPMTGSAIGKIELTKDETNVTAGEGEFSVVGWQFGGSPSYSSSSGRGEILVGDLAGHLVDDQVDAFD